MMVVVMRMIRFYHIRANSSLTIWEQETDKLDCHLFKDIPVNLCIPSNYLLMGKYSIFAS